MVWILKPFKRFLQWTLGCTYAKKTIRNRIRDMFYFTEAPHIVIYEISEHEPWWTKLGLIVGILLSVMLIYYLLEMAFQTARRLIHQYLSTLETHSTISTPRCLSPTKSVDKIRTLKKVGSRKSKSSTKRSGKKQKIRMNEPVNCVFIRPSSSKLSAPSTPTSKGVEKENPQDKSPLRTPDSSARVLLNPTDLNKKPSETKNTPDRGKSGADEETSVEQQVEEAPPKIVLGNIMEWLAAQNLETETDQESVMKMATISPISITENVSEMSYIEPITASSNDSNWTEKYATTNDEITEKKKKKNKKILMAKSPSFDEIDVIIDDNHLFSDKEDENFGNVLLKEGQSKVLFRWTEANPESVEKITLGGSFFGWKMTVPMRQHVNDVRVFTANLELPSGLHQYCIRVERCA